MMKDCQAICTYIYLEAMKALNLPRRDYRAIFDSFPCKLLEHSVRHAVMYSKRSARKTRSDYANCRYQKLLLIFETDSITSQSLVGIETTPQTGRGRRGYGEKERKRENQRTNYTWRHSTGFNTHRVECNESTRRVKSRQVGQRSLSRSFYLAVRFSLLVSFAS